MHSGWCEIRPGSLCGWRTAQFVAARFAPHVQLQKKYFLFFALLLLSLCLCDCKMLRESWACSARHRFFLPRFRGLFGHFCVSAWLVHFCMFVLPCRSPELLAMLELTKKCAPSGNQTRVWSVAGTYTITVLTALRDTRTQDRTGDLSRVRRAS